MTLPGTTAVRDLHIECIVGIHPQERTTPQMVIVDLEFDYDFAQAAATDAIAHVVNYDEAVAQVRQLIVARQFQLIETMAAEVSAQLLDRHPRVQRVRVGIQKPAAVPGASGSYVHLERRRS